MISFTDPMNCYLASTVPAEVPSADEKPASEASGLNRNGLTLQSARGLPSNPRDVGHDIINIFAVCVSPYLMDPRLGGEVANGLGWAT